MRCGGWFGSCASISLLVRNVTSEYITIPKHAEMAVLEVGFVEEPAAERDSASPGTVESMVDWDGCTLTDSQRENFLAVLKKYEPMFDGHVGFTNLVSHKIETGDHPPIRHESPSAVTSFT